VDIFRQPVLAGFGRRDCKASTTGTPCPVMSVLLNFVISGFLSHIFKVRWMQRADE
jgi:hypothetical protein